MGGVGLKGRAAAWGLGLALGCSGDVYLCQDDPSCEQGGVSGVCQATGYCSFPDAECSSGQRYGAHAGGSLADTCVELEPATGDTGVSATGGSVGTSEVDGSGTASSTATASTTVSLDGPVSTGPDDTGLGTTAGTTTVDDGSGSTTAGGVACWSDDFGDGMLGPPWCTMVDPGLEVSEPGGRLRFAFVPTDWGMGTRAARATTCDVFPLLGATASVELVDAPQVSPQTEAFIEMGYASLRVGLGVIDAQLEVFVFDGAGYAVVSTQPYSPMGQRYLRIVGDELGLVAEHSPDGVAWVPVHTVPVDLVGIEGEASLGGFGSSVPLGPDEALFDDFELCPGE